MLHKIPRVLGGYYLPWLYLLCYYDATSHGRTCRDSTPTLRSKVMRLLGGNSEAIEAAKAAAKVGRVTRSTLWLYLLCLYLLWRRGGQGKIA